MKKLSQCFWLQEPFLIIEDVVGTYELSSCYNVTIDCRAADMIATVRTNKIFNGKIYAKDNPNSCVVDVEAGIEFSIKMAYNDLECNVKRKTQGVYTNEVIIQHHDSIVTSSDLGLALNCQYDLSNRTIVNDFDLAIEGEIEPSMFEESVVDSPNVLMKITKRGGGDVDSAQVGDPLELRFEIFDEQSPYEIFVRDLLAKDGNDQNQIVLLDGQGCPTEGQIMGPLNKDPNNPKILIANFDAFKFPTSQVVQFRAHVTPCMPTCEPVECVYDEYFGIGTGDTTLLSSYGKRRKRSYMDRNARAIGNKNNAADLLVTQAFVVVDKFNNRNPGGAKSPAPIEKPREIFEGRTDISFGQEFKSTAAPAPSPAVPPRFEASPQPATKVESSSTEPELCLNAVGIVVSLAMFLVAQLIVILAAIHFWQRRRKQKKERDEGIKNMFNPYANQR